MKLHNMYTTVVCLIKMKLPSEIIVTGTTIFVEQIQMQVCANSGLHEALHTSERMHGFMCENNIANDRKQTNPQDKAHGAKVICEISIHVKQNTFPRSHRFEFPEGLDPNPICTVLVVGPPSCSLWPNASSNT